MIRYYLFDSAGVFTGYTDRPSIYHSYPANSTTIDPGDVMDGEFSVFNGAGWDIVTERPEVVIPIPQSVTMRQARLALLSTGRLADVDTAIAALSEPDKSAAAIEWEYSQTVERNRPFVATLGAALSLDDAALDNLFILAASL